ncbi:MAG: hypothetical protein ACYDC6_15545 [Acidobacteriaceae bacterium]
MDKVSPADDAKLQHLKEHILDKINSPINPGNRKILLFTAFSDTADYLYEHLAPVIRERRPLPSAEWYARGFTSGTGTWTCPWRNLRSPQSQ